jgi:hypothetical protein
MTPTRTTAALLATCVACAVIPPAPAQVSPQGQQLGFSPRDFSLVELRPVQQGAADINPVSTSLRWQPLDLRQPANFDRVYRLSDVIDPATAPPGVFPQDGGFVRFDAGVSAVYPWSSYAHTRRGTFAEIPAGTVFHIGLQPARPGEFPTATLAPPNYVNLSANLAASSLQVTQTGNQTGTQAGVPEAAAASLWTDDAYRRKRVGALIDAVARRAGASR